MCVGAGRMCTVPKPFPKEFRQDVIGVYRDSDASMAQVAKDFGISASCLKRWLTIDGRTSARSSSGSRSGSESDELREANKRIKLLEQENEVLRRAAAYLSQAHLPGK
jgi:transposase-like protein